MEDFRGQLFQLFEVSGPAADLILSKFEREEVDRQSSFLEVGQRCDRLSFIESGYFRVYRWTSDREHSQWIGGPGYFVTDLSSYFFDQEALWSIEAITPAVIWTLSKSSYRSIEREIPEWNRLEKRFFAKCFMQLEARVFDFISLSAEERYLQYFERNKALFNQVPLHYIASVLGMSPETLSRIRNKTS